MSHWEFLRQHQLTQLIKQLITQLGFKLFSSGIRQWGSTAEETKTSFDVKLNITMNVMCAIPYDISSNPSSICYLCWMNEKTTTMTLAFCASTVPYGFGWIAIGKQ